MAIAFAGRKVRVKCESEADAEDIRRIARKLTKAMKGKGLHEVVTVNFYDNYAILEVI